MTEEERLQEYFKERAAKDEKRKGNSSGETKFKRVPLNPNAETPLRWYITDTIFFVVKAIVATIGITFLSVLVYDSSIQKIKDEELHFVLYFAAGVFFLFLLNRMVRLIFYLSWIKGKLYPLKGWDEFLAKRGDKFWSGGYTNIRISVRFSSEVTNDDRALTATYMTKWAEKWANRYKKMVWEPGSGKPNDFSSDGKSIHGDISERGLHRLLHRTLFYLPKLARKLGTHLEMIVVESGTQEDIYTSPKIKDDAYDKNFNRELRRSLKE